MSLLWMIAGCTQTGNPLSSTDTVTRGTLDYILASPARPYQPGDTLTATVTVHNTGSITDTAVGGGGNLEWFLVTTTGDTLFVGGPGDNVVELVPVPPGQSKQLYSIKWPLSRNLLGSFPTGFYSLRVTVRPVSMAVNFYVQ